MSSLKVRVVRVIDGDSLEVQVWRNGVPGGDLLEVRLSGLDAPERGQRGWRDAAARLADVVGWDVSVLDFVELDCDRRSRRVGLLYPEGEYPGDPDVESLNLLMVREGWAWFYDGSRGLCDAFIENALLYQEDARERRQGIWAFPRRDWISPWDWRDGVR